MVYRVVEKEHVSEEGKQYTSYGIELFDGEELLRSAYDIDTDYSRVEKLCALCNLFSLSPIHFEDVIEDYLAR